MSNPPPPRLAPSLSAADLVGSRLAPKSRFPFSISLPHIHAPPKSKGKQKNDDEQDSNLAAVEDSDPAQTIKLNVPHLADDDEYKDKYEW